jgi:hypothetical protein
MGGSDYTRTWLFDFRKENDFQKKGGVTLNEMQLNREATIT